ncbi:unnamed protein product [Closterium sp. Yama58-4]|nr:unnamed protein product [Closterium sp. Yama58-4]
MPRLQPPSVASFLVSLTLFAFDASRSTAAQRAPRFRRMWRDRWLGLILGMWLQACGGISYAFSLYSAALKDKLQYSQEAVDGLGTAKDIGGNVGIVSGLLIDLMPAWAILAIGAAMHLFGYSMLYMASMGITRPPFWQVRSLPSPLPPSPFFFIQRESEEKA